MSSFSVQPVERSPENLLIVSRGWRERRAWFDRGEPSR
jgi:hypothetical protein